MSEPDELSKIRDLGKRHACVNLFLLVSALALDLVNVLKAVDERSRLHHVLAQIVVPFTEPVSF